jgi:hypothetical protein
MFEKVNSNDERMIGSLFVNENEENEAKTRGVVKFWWEKDIFGAIQSVRISTQNMTKEIIQNNKL